MNASVLIMQRCNTDLWAATWTQLSLQDFMLLLQHIVIYINTFHASVRRTDSTWCWCSPQTNDSDALTQIFSHCKISASPTSEYFHLSLHELLIWKFKVTCCVLTCHSVWSRHQQHQQHTRRPHHHGHRGLLLSVKSPFSEQQAAGTWLYMACGWEGWSNACCSPPSLRLRGHLPWWWFVYLQYRSTSCRLALHVQ